jgi:hypothetical protein
VRARARYTRTVRLQRCTAKTGKKRAACIRSAGPSPERRQRRRAALMARSASRRASRSAIVRRLS